MTLDQAITLLDRCTRESSYDCAFGDTETGWYLDGKHVAEGYFSGSVASVTFLEEGIVFEGEDARQLSNRGTRGDYSRNDTVGEYGRYW